MLYKLLPNEVKQSYKKDLSLIGSLSRLFSDAIKPYLHYRVAEKIFCDNTGAVDCSRSDVSFDAVYNNFGIGLKTFLHNNGNTFQKIAEFNALKNEYESLSDIEIVEFISEARNRRLETTLSQYGKEDMLYHLVTRLESEFRLYEEKMVKINLAKICQVKRKKSIIHFSDGLCEYSFNKSKSTLLKRFRLSSLNPCDVVKVNIIQDPISLLRSLEYASSKIYKGEDSFPEIYLPLYITKKSKPYEYGDVHERACLNQWNAKGRPRDFDEVYIPVPSMIHKTFPDFFPDNNDDRFLVLLPDGQELDCSMCQSNQKGLMSNPNKNLGNWLLRKVLKLQKGQLATRRMLNSAGIDCVRVQKINKKKYKIDFANIGGYEEFLEKNGLSF
ncbi:MAG: NgoFVII family restriction endonuclease [Chlamydiales bacterium]|nr:NgoFVII family restriction endonuclease [Chlamydiales bacterium]